MKVEYWVETGGFRGKTGKIGTWVTFKVKVLPGIRHLARYLGFFGHGMKSPDRTFAARRLEVL